MLHKIKGKLFCFGERMIFLTLETRTVALTFWSRLLVPRAP